MEASQETPIFDLQVSCCLCFHKLQFAKYFYIVAHQNAAGFQGCIPVQSEITSFNFSFE